MISLEIITGILGGSLFTLFVKEIINQINKRQEHSRELKKITYIRKLEKAENAIAYYSVYLTKVIEMKKYLEFMANALNDIDNNDYDLGFIQEIMEKAGNMLSDLSGEKYIGINSIQLYFNLDRVDWNQQDIANLIQALSETKAIDNSIQFWTGLHNNASNDNKADLYWNKVIELLPSYLNSVFNFLSIIEKNENSIQQTIQIIKKDFKIH